MNYINSLVKLIRSFFEVSREDKVLEACGCICYCPSCDDILNDQADCEDNEFVIYICTVCGQKSKWSFDIAPCPILTRS